MDPEQPPVSWSPPPLPPPLYQPPPLPPPWQPTAPTDVPSGAHVARWTLGVLALLAIAASVFVLVGRHTVAATPKLGSTPTATAAPPSATPVSAAVAEAGTQYLTAVALVNADGDNFHAALDADQALPCSCPPGEFQIRADALATIPALTRDTASFQVALQMIKNEVPGIAADIDIAVTDNQQYTDDLAAAYRAGQQKGGAVAADIGAAEAVDEASRPDFARLRVDLGLPPPPIG